MVIEGVLNIVRLSIISFQPRYRRVSANATDCRSRSRIRIDDLIRVNRMDLG